MNHFTMKYFFVLLAVLTLAGCGKKDKQGKGEDGEPVIQEENAVNYVTTSVLQATDFYHELISNGKLLSRRKVELRFQSSDPIATIYVKNGDRVKKGAKLAELNTYNLQNQLKQAEINLERSRLSLQEALLGQGYNLRDSADIPEKTWRVLSTKSGYDDALLEYEQSKYEYDKATLIAPFEGVVANLFEKELNQPEPKAFCVLMDNKEMEVSFSILENELGLVKTGDPVSVIPLVIDHEELTGRISEINPLVESNGLVRLKAVIPNPAGKLYEGMNVRISIQRSIPDQWVVPKEAIVLRTGKQVMFTKRDGRSFWNYVETGLENSSSFTVTGKDLHEGDTVIVSGNMNLAHDVPVKERSRR